MKSLREHWNDKSIELVIGNLLRVGVLLSAAVVLTGGVMYLFEHGMTQPHYRMFSLESAQLRHMPAIFRDAMALHSKGIIQLGLLLLIATPIARVAFSVFAFLVERDLMYVVITLIVLSILLFSLFGGHAL